VKNLFLFLALSLSAPSSYSKQKNEVIGQLIQVDADPKKGFNFPFLIYLPKADALQRRILVVPNNSGSSLIDFPSQFQSAKRQTLSWGTLAERISSILVVPCFPRPDVDPPIYTHSLSRSTLEVKTGDLKRVDLQLIKMIEAAKVAIKHYGVKSPFKKVYLFGFSASAMFVNRFTFLHPELVEAVAFGAPGGWPLAPFKEFKERALPYPIGIADIKTLVDKDINLDEVKKIPMFAYLGSKDENDSVVFRDSFSEADEKLIFSLFGKTPVSRWPAAEKLYKDAGLNAKFKLYEGLGHETNGQIQDDLVQFFNGLPKNL
jgi:predicted esterase